MTGFLKGIADLLPPEAWVTLIIGSISIVIVLWEFKQSYKQTKKAKVFDDLSSKIQECTDLLGKITNDTNAVLQQLAESANLASADFDVTSMTDAQVEKESLRRLDDLEKNYAVQNILIKSVANSFREILLLIKQVEKSTLVGESTKRAVRYLFFFTDEQKSTLDRAYSVLYSFETVPVVGKQLNITSKTFKAFADLLYFLNAKNELLSIYLEDLEIILHNDLVKGIYGPAKLTSIPKKHLTSTGLTDERVKSSIL